MEKEWVSRKYLLSFGFYVVAVTVERQSDALCKNGRSFAGSEVAAIAGLYIHGRF